MIDELSSSLLFIIQKTNKNALILAWIIAIPWVIFFITHVLNPRLLTWGIFPRHPRGLPGILFAPLLHAHFNHLFYNSIPLLVLSDFLLIHGLTYFLIATLTITILSGLFMWLFARPGLHIGASGLITGFWGMLVSDIYQQGTWLAIVLGLTSLYAFSGIFLGIFPRERGVSWEGHLFGLIAGILTSYCLSVGGFA